MPRGKLSKNDILARVYKLKNNLRNEDPAFYHNDPKALADKYLNAVLDCINEFNH